jgi:chitin-binding protein
MAAIVAALVGVTLTGTAYAAGTATAGTAGDVGAQVFQQRWGPNPGTDGLDAFVGIEDDRSHSHPGVKHIFAEPDQYRFVIHKRDRDGSDRQRQEVRAIRKGSERVDMHKGETWMYTYQMYIPAH